MDRWAMYFQLMVLGIILCMIALIVLAVPYIFDHWRRWRERGRTDALINGRGDRGPASKAAQRAERLGIAGKGVVAQDALGWRGDAVRNEDMGHEPSDAPPTPRDRGKTVLVADDDPVVLLALSQRLQHMGFRVLRSPDATHALLGAMKTHPDLVILDVNMPSGNGLAVCEMMASDPRCAGIPVVIHSVFGDEVTKERCLRLGAHHVEKSTHSWDEIRALIERLLGDEATEPVEKPAIHGQPPAAVVAVEAKAETEVETEVETETAGPATEPGPQAATESIEQEAASRSAAAVKVSASETPATVSPVCGRPRVLCVGSPPSCLELVDHQLTGLGMEVVRVDDLEEGFWSCFTEKPHVIILQCGEDEKKLRKFIAHLMEHPVTRAIPILVIDEGGFLSGGGPAPAANVRVLQHPVEWQELLARLEEFLSFFSHGTEDPLTSISRIPAAREQAGPTAVANTTAEEPSSPPVLRVLCIDDDPVVTKAIAFRMQPYGIELLPASNGTQGYLLAAAKRPDLVLLDMQMPGGDGHYVLSKLKDNPQTANIPVIILTVETHPGVRRQMLSLGADAFVTKPVRWRELFVEMGRYVELPNQLVHDYKLSQEVSISL